MATSSPSDRLAKALTMLGRVVKSIYILKYLNEEDLRHRVQLQLNRGEHRHSLARWIFFADQGEFRTGDYQEIMNKASCLSLVSNAILVWNITLKCVSRPVRTKRKRVPQGCKLPVLLGTKEVFDIRERTFVSPGLLIGGIVQPNGSLRFDWSLGDIEEIQGHVAASANHTDDSKLEKRLDRIYSKLQRFLDSYDDSGTKRP